MTLSVTNAQQERSVYTATSLDTWTTLASSPYATWANWTQWNTNPRTISATETIDEGSVLLRTPTLVYGSNVFGTVTIKISDTGLFAGEETTITPSLFVNQTYPAGRHYRVTVTLAPDSQGTIPYLAGWNWVMVRNFITEDLFDVNTASLSGTQDSRLLSTTVPIVTDMRAMSQTSEPYVTATYVASSYIVDGEATYVSYISKGTTPRIRVSDNAGTIDGIIDITVRGLPSITQNELGHIVEA